MIRLFKNKILIIIGVVALLLVFIALSLSQKSSSQEDQGVSSPSATPTLSQNLNTTVINNVSPSEGTTLETGKVQTFTIYLGKPLVIGQIKIILKSYDYTKDNIFVSDVPFKATFTAHNVIEVRTTNPIVPHTTYLLQMTTLTDNKVVLNLTYSSQLAASPTPVQNNNDALIPYLPHETDNYKLSYFAAQNMYVFNFKYDSSSDLNIIDQFNQAKQDAINFIQSKGIDINSIVIDWRSS
jgi:hypothetical protein